MFTPAATMGHSLGLEVIAEGVEELSQARQLRTLTCDVIQGYLVSRPLPIHDITELLGAFTPLDTSSEDSHFSACFFPHPLLIQ